MKRFLFMYTSFGGHVLEYFIHIYHYAIDDELFETANTMTNLMIV